MNKLIRITKKFMLGLIIIAVCLFTFIASPTSPLKNQTNKVVLNADTWNSKLAEIENIQKNILTKYISIKDLLTLDSEDLVLSASNPSSIDENTVIMLNDGLDVYYFSEVCNPTFANGNLNPHYKTYLTLNYTLGADIDYEDASKTFKMLRPIGWKEPFDGVFDARGYTISNIFFRPFEDITEIQNDYPELIYVSWFSQNTGIIKNLGIINANMIQYNVYEPSILASPFVGINLEEGEIENCFVQDLRKSESGLSVEGGYDVSMFVSDNLGLIKNCYVACDRITSSSITITSASSRHPFCDSNSGTLVDCYYDIDTLTSQGQTYTEPEYVGLTGLKTVQFLTDDFNYKNDNGEFEGIWYSNYTYPVLHASYLKLNYPILKGFDTTTVDNHDYFVVKDVVDFIYLSELIEKYQPFRSSSYLLTNSIDLNSVKPNSYVFSSAVFSGTLKSGYKTNDGYTTTYSSNVIFDDNYSITLKDGNLSNFNSIINLDINTGNSYNGYNCYGLFGVLAGTVENINIVNTTISLAGIKELNEHEINTIGTVCGLLEGGNIDNVNIYSDIYLSKDKSATSAFLGAINVGGICGTATDGSISSCTTNGYLHQVTYNTIGTQAHVHSIGGVLGKAINNDDITNCLNNIEIHGIEYQTNNALTGYRQYVGGVIGSGEINNASKLQNNALIYIGRTNVTTTKYSQTYVSGIIGRVENATGSNGLYLNNSNIYYYVNDNNYKAYISGVMNVISTTADKYDAFNITLNATNVQQELNDQKPFEFTSLSNAGILNIENELTASKYPAKYGVFTTVNNGIDIRSAGIIYSYLTNMNVTGGYNLNYHYERVNNELKTIDNTPQNIDISMIDKYAPTFNADNKLYYLNNQLHIDTNILINGRVQNQTVKINTPTIQTSVALERVYNYNQTNYITKKPVNMFNLQLSGCVNGRNFNLENIRNDGDVNVYFTHATNSIKFANATYRDYFGADKTLKVYGVFEEVSLNHRAKDIYNGGNITISQNESTVPNFILYGSGIGYKNVGNDRPETDSLLIEKGYVGSLHNCVNNGDIRLTRGDITVNKDITEPGHFYGGVRLSGIVGINSSTISQTFNLGNVYNINEAYQDGNRDYGDFGGSPTLEIETGGFCYVMQNEIYDASNNTTQANIIDSANNGTIVAINSGTNQSFTNAGGFVARNDRGEEGELVTDNSVSRNSHTIKIQYSINYGDIYAVNRFYDTMYGGEQQSKAAGFICLGACTVVDVINYGNIYGSEVASGIFGYLFIQRMNAGGMDSDSPIYIANSINYGKAQIVNRTAENIKKICNIDEEKAELDLLDVNSSWDGNTTNISVAGALIGVWSNGTGNADLESLNVKYLVNFCDDLDILGWTYNSNYNNVDNLKFKMLENMATTKENDTSPAPFDTDNVNYAYGIRCYSKDTAMPNANEEDIYSQEHNGGIFNENYSLRKPGEFTYDQNGNIDLNDTDNFIADYIQFVPYSKVNDYLVVKIGLESTVLANTYDNALVNSKLIQQVITAKYTSDQIKDIYDELLTKYSNSLNQKKNVIAEAIVSYLKEHPEYADDLAAELTSDSTIFASILDSSDVQTILSKIIKNLSDTDKDLVIEIFNNLVNTNTFETLIDGMQESEKDQILTEIFDLVKDDQDVLNAIATKVYEDLNITSTDDLATLRDELLTARLNSNADLADYPISRDEYANMYLLSRINSLSNNDLNTFLQNIQNQLNNTNNAVYRFVESGRQNSSKIYLPASSENYVTYLNSTNYSYGGNTGTAGNNQTYTGTVLNINGDLVPSNYYELYITNGRITIRGNYGSTGYFGWEVRNNSYTLISGADNNDYIVYYRSGSESGSQGWPTNISSTGVYIDLSNVQKNPVSSGNNWNRVTYEDYNFNINNFQVLRYIDYGSSAVDKNPNNNTNLSNSMITQMRNLVNTNATKVKEYLMQIYANSNEDAASFLSLIPNSNTNNMNVTQLVKNIINSVNGYLNGNNKTEALTKAYANAILDNVSDNTAKANIVKLFFDDSTDYDVALADMIKALDSSNQSHYEAIKTILPVMFNYSFSGVSDANQISIANKLFTYGQANSLITTNDNISIIKQSVIGNVNSIDKIMDNINDAGLYAEVIANLIVGNKADFGKYTGLTEANILTELEELGIDASIVTDFTGIYALASSLGIEAGLFLPDNIELIGMDYYYTDDDGKETNDPTWRGGTSDEPNSYNENDTDKVNYKVYYEMKQLKKSIATIIFEMELTDGNNIVTNDVDTDYFCSYKELQDDGSYITKNEVYYYVPYNHDILLSDYIYVNTSEGSYELSYGATFDPANELKISVPDIDTLRVGDTLMDTFIVQAEDITVKTTYTVVITITESSYFNFDIDNTNNTRFNVSFNGVASDVNPTTNEIYDGVTVVTDVEATSKVNGYNGIIRFTLSTFNMMNKLNMTKNIKVYQAKSDAIDKEYKSTMFKELTLNVDYTLNNVINNGIVVIPGASGTGYNPATNAYNPGTVFFDLSLNNNLSMGTYLIEVVLNSELSYYLLFDKAASNYAMLESITYNNQEFDNDNKNSNEEDYSTHEYGTTISEVELLDGKYIDSIEISPLSTYEITSATVTETNGVKQYLITYVITAEDGVTKFTFTHYIREENYSTYINNIYYNGGIIEEGPIEKGDKDYIFKDSFEKTSTPSYRFDYHLTEFYTEVDSDFFKVIAYDHNGEELSDELIAEYMNINITEGLGFEVSFLAEALSEVYYFELVYENEFKFNANKTLNWNVVFDRIMIEKLKSRNSYLDNATFLSESVVSSIRTMIDIDEITLEEYKEMLTYPTRKIVCLPGQIHYNEYSYSYDESTKKVKKQDDFYVIGLVNKTQLEWYSPTFTLPEGAKIYRTYTDNDDVLYRYVPYYTEKLNDLTAFLVSEDGTSFRDEKTKELINVTGDENSFEYNGKTYTLSPVAGLQTIEYNGVNIVNTTLYTNYNDEGSFKEGPNGEEDGYFDFVHYRVYAEIYGDKSIEGNESDYYTDYFIATQDLTNNIRFNIIIDKAAGCDINTKVYNVYAEFVCYQLVGSTENDEVRDDNYELYNRAGLFGYFKDESVDKLVVADHITLQSNTFGWYSIYLALPDGYTFTYRFEDKGQQETYKEGQECYVESSITARTVTIHITIDNDNINSNDDWGVNVEDESFIKPITKEEE